MIRGLINHRGALSKNCIWMVYRSDFMETSMLNPGDYVGVSFWIISAAMVAATFFFWVERDRAEGKWKTSLSVAAMVTGIAAIHYFYMRDVWVMTGDSPTRVQICRLAADGAAPDHRVFPDLIGDRRGQRDPVLAVADRLTGDAGLGLYRRGGTRRAPLAHVYHRNTCLDLYHLRDICRRSQ